MLHTGIIQGRLTKEPELKTTQTGKEVVSITVACNDNYDREKTYFFTVKAWQKTAVFISQYFHKGDMILVSGDLVTNEYEKDGQKRVSWELIAKEVNFAGEKKSSISISVDDNGNGNDDDGEELPF